MGNLSFGGDHRNGESEQQPLTAAAPRATTAAQRGRLLRQHLRFIATAATQGYNGRSTQPPSTASTAARRVRFLRYRAPHPPPPACDAGRPNQPAGRLLQGNGTARQTGVCARHTHIPPCNLRTRRAGRDKHGGGASARRASRSRSTGGTGRTPPSDLSCPDERVKRSHEFDEVSAEGQGGAYKAAVLAKFGAKLTGISKVQGVVVSTRTPSSRLEDVTTAAAGYDTTRNPAPDSATEGGGLHSLARWPRYQAPLPHTMGTNRISSQLDGFSTKEKALHGSGPLLEGLRVSPIRPQGLSYKASSGPLL